jgi:hypothetical protein
MQQRLTAISAVISSLQGSDLADQRAQEEHERMIEDSLAFDEEVAHARHETEEADLQAPMEQDLFDQHLVESVGGQLVSPEVLDDDDTDPLSPAGRCDPSLANSIDVGCPLASSTVAMTSFGSWTLGVEAAARRSGCSPFEAGCGDASSSANSALVPPAPPRSFIRCCCSSSRERTGQWCFAYVDAGALLCSPCLAWVFVHLPMRRVFTTGSFMVGSREQ